MATKLEVGIRHTLKVENKEDTITSVNSDSIVTEEVYVDGHRFDIPFKVVELNLYDFSIPTQKEKEGGRSIPLITYNVVEDNFTDNEMNKFIRRCVAYIKYG